MPASYEIRLQNGRVLRTTPVFDSYWRFAAERQAMFMRRVIGSSPPWTKDAILRAHRFTNTYRASDRVSQYLIRHVIYDGSQKAEEVFFRTLLFKLFNKIETWEALQAELGELTWRDYRFDGYANVLDRIMGGGDRIYSAAYIMPSPAFGNARKHRNHLRLIEHMMADDVTRKLAKVRALSGVFELLRGYPSLGDFLAFQFAIDLNYSQIIDFSEMEFVVAGPGARDGIRKCFLDTGGLSEAEIIRVMAERADAEFERLGVRFQNLWGRDLQLIDCQNVFCEIGKYARVAHPEVAGESGRTRIKQKYKPRAAPIPQWYPPKWGLKVNISTGLGNGPTRATSRHKRGDAGEAARP